MRHDKIEANMNGTTTFSKACEVTGSVFKVTARDADIAAWKNGLYAQDAFPELDADQREFIMTGYTPAEWDKLFGEVEE